MVYFQIERHVPEHYTVTGPLYPGEVVSGQVNGELTTTRIESAIRITRNGDDLSGPDGAILFDRKRFYSSRKAVVYLPSVIADLLMLDRTLGDDGAMQDGYSSLWRRMLEQTGYREPGKRSLGEKAFARLSIGWTERYS